MKREAVNLPIVNMVPLEWEATACTSSGAQQIIPAISAGLIALFLVW
ncbi:hypothetical protein [Chromobacterium sp. IIBBL 290-4]|nr:hypothetical protein [Chromobacterium sp. IIBBL 290-4]UTH72708.1 hypothetical protein NKT35_14300 [Chromobacterium sp. IIBBL 290-4]